MVRLGGACPPACERAARAAHARGLTTLADGTPPQRVPTGLCAHGKRIARTGLDHPRGRHAPPARADRPVRARQTSCMHRA
eukprot:6193571-Pleurochrysis_carterae.AAC.1